MDVNVSRRKILFIVFSVFLIAIYSFGAINHISGADTEDNSNNDIDSVSEAKLTVGYYKFKKFSTGADISSIKEFKKFNKKGLLTRVLFNQKNSKGKIVKGLASKGTPVFKFTNGKGPKTIIIAGTHGDEYASQAAALKLINYLNAHKNKIHGTVIIIPMTNPKATVNKKRSYFGYDPNRVVGKKGSFTNKIFTQIILKEKVKYVGDFHTMVGGTTYFFAAPYPKSKKIAKAIAKSIKHNYRVSQNKGTFTRTSAKYGLYSFTGEVESKRGAISKNRDKLSYKQMIAFLKYTKNI
jgi:predicted deacylase